jgi:hypothetical protein
VSRRDDRTWLLELGQWITERKVCADVKRGIIVNDCCGATSTYALLRVYLISNGGNFSKARLRTAIYIPYFFA